MAEINLLPVEEKRSESFEGLRQKLSMLSVILLVGIACAAIGVLAFFTTLISTKQKLIGRIEESSAEINRFKVVEELSVVTKSKVSVADKILSGRTDQVKIFTTFSEIVPPGVYFTDIKFAADRASFTGKAATSADLANLVSLLLSPKGTGVVSDINIDTLSADEKGEYAFGISGTLAGVKVAPSPIPEAAPVGDEVTR